MRRFLTLVCLLGLALPAGISISGCVRNPAGKYCNGLGYGLTLTQVANLTLQPELAGVSLAYGQTTAILPPTATTCKGDSASIATGSLSYGTTNNQLVDISPSGNICAGTWNRNTGGGIADFTTCTPPPTAPSSYLAYVTPTAEGASSNSISSGPRHGFWRKRKLAGRSTSWPEVRMTLSAGRRLWASCARSMPDMPAIRTSLIRSVISGCASRSCSAS